MQRGSSYANLNWNSVTESKRFYHVPAWGEETERMITNGLCEHSRACEHSDFFTSRSRDKKFALRAVERVQLASSEHFLYFPLAAIHIEILFFKNNKTENILKRGFNLECSKFFEASLSDTLSKSNQLQSRLMPNDVTFSLHHARVGTDQKAKVTRRTTIYNNNI